MQKGKQGEMKKEKKTLKIHMNIYMSSCVLFSRHCCSRKMVHVIQGSVQKEYSNKSIGKKLSLWSFPSKSICLKPAFKSLHLQFKVEQNKIID